MTRSADSADPVSVQPHDPLARLPGYLPGWSPASGSAAAGLLRVAARYADLVAASAGRAPDRALLALLDLLGLELLPAQPARAPLVFSMLPDSPVDITLPPGAQVAAPARSAPPAPVGAPQPLAPQPTLFTLVEPISVARARLAALYSRDPGRDTFADHSAALTAGFQLFPAREPAQHALYLGHGHLFALAGDISVILSFALERPAGQELAIAWEYLAEAGWLPLERATNEDTSAGLQQDGQLVLRRRCGPDAAPATFAGRTGFWVRGRLRTPLSPTGPAGRAAAVAIDTIRASVAFSKSDLLPEAAFADGTTLDPSRPFAPFGPQPGRGTAFYLASAEVFKRKGAFVRLRVNLASAGAPSPLLRLMWEYHSGQGWAQLSVTPDPALADSYRFARSGDLTFLCPADWAEAEVNGVKSYWLRARIAGGDFGHPPRLDLAPQRAVVGLWRDPATGDFNHARVVLASTAGFAGGESVRFSNDAGTPPIIYRVVHIEADDSIVLDSALPTALDPAGGTIGAPDGIPALLPPSLAPPLIERVSLDFSYLTDPEPLDYCLAENDFVFRDHSDDCRWPDGSFQPFTPVEVRRPAVYLGFDRALPPGLVSLYVDVAAPAAEESPPTASTLDWEYRAAHGWSRLAVRDETAGFLRSGMLQFVGPTDAAPSPGPGGQLYRVRATAQAGERAPERPIRGIWLNAAWVEERRSFTREPLGSTDGVPGQTVCFPLQRVPVLEGERVELREWSGRGAGWESFVAGVPAADLRHETDPASGEVRTVWVSWHQRPHLLASGPQDRHYTIERSTGLLRFGDGRYGMLPPAGVPVVATYGTGGGLAGNLPAGAISELRTAAPYLVGVRNPVAASGGAVTEPVAAAAERGPQRLRHGDRAITAADYEWLAREASPAVARARCLPLHGPDGHAQRGWITLVVVPRSAEPQPQPDPELRRRVRAFLAERVPASAARRIRIVAPTYTPVSVAAEVVPRHAGEAALVEIRLRERLSRLLHPLDGGPDGRGWAFGQDIHLSMVARVIAEIEGVAYAVDIRLMVGDTACDEHVPIPPDGLVASGEHLLKLRLSEE
jgi:hypothetical protein